MTGITVSDKEDVEVSAKGVILKGAYADLRPAIQRSVSVAETVLSVIDNLVGLPADFLNHHLTTFRDRYRERLEAIPPERRDVPPLRIGCSVLKEVAFAAEEPEIQKMFADLLGTSSDTQTQGLAHPGFADVINQLTPLDAKILRAVVKPAKTYITGIRYHVIKHHFSSRVEPQKDVQFRTAVDNLVRLGLLEWEAQGVSWHDASNLKPQRRSSRISTFSNDVSNDVRDLKDSLKEMDSSFTEFADKLMRVLEKVGDKVSLKGTQFGRQFVSACLVDGEVLEEPIGS